MRATFVHSEQETFLTSEGSEPEVSDAIKYFARHYRTGGKEIPQFDVTEGVEGIDFPALAIPLRSIGPDLNIINIDDDLSEKTNKELINGEDGEDDGGEDDEDEDETAEMETIEIETVNEETPVASSSRVYEGTWAGAESAAPLQKKKIKKIIPMDPDEIPDRSGKEPCPYW